MVLSGRKHSNVYSGVIMSRHVALLLIVATALCSAACGIGEEPGSVSLKFVWEDSPEGVLEVWIRVEERDDPAQPGPILASSGPDTYEHGQPFSTELGTVSNGGNRVVVVEFREGKSAGLPVVYYGLSLPFSVEPGRNTSVEVAVAFQKPRGDEVEGGVLLRFEDYDVSPDAVGLDLARNAVVRTRSSGAVSLVLANDVSFSANLTTIELSEARKDNQCWHEEDNGTTVDVCDIAGWNLQAGLPEGLGDGLYSVYVKFVDQYGYESKAFKDSVLLDTQGPVVIVASLTPELAKAEQEVLLTVTFLEPLNEEEPIVLTVSPEPGDLFGFQGPERIGESNSYIWAAGTAAVQEDTGQVYTFTVEAHDQLGNPGDVQGLTNSSGDPLEFILDGLAPVVVDSEALLPNEDVFGIEGEGVPEPRILTLDFAVEERRPLALELAEDGINCVANCPRVQVDDLEVGQVTVNPALDDPDNHRRGFAWSYVPMSTDFPDVQKWVELTIGVQDLAGNEAWFGAEGGVYLDFQRPGALDCQLFPNPANGDAVITYRVTADEPIMPWETEINVESTAGDTLFEQWDVNGQTLTWTQAAASLAEQDFTVEVVLRDQSGNFSDGAVCQMAGVIDGTAPQLVLEPAPVFSDTVFGVIDGGACSGNWLEVVFALEEPLPAEYSVGGADNCEGQCPVVLLDGAPFLGETFVGSIFVAPEAGDPDNGIHAFGASICLHPDDWGDVEKEVEVAVRWQDAAGNVVQEVLSQKITLDFITPEATECLLTPEYANLGSIITYSITASELLPEVPQLYTAPANFVAFAGEPTVSAGGYKYTWQQAAADLPTEDFAVEFITVKANLIDLAGNESGWTACESTVFVDLKVPEFYEPTVTLTPESLNWDGEPMTIAGPGALIEVAFALLEKNQPADVHPKVYLDVPGAPVDFAMDSVEKPTENSFPQYKYSLQLPVDEPIDFEGYWPIRLEAVDQAGNTAWLDNAAKELVRIDATPPIAQCSLIPSPPEDGKYAIGQKVTIQVTPMEELAWQSPPMLDANMAPDQDVAFEHEDGSTWRYSLTVPDGGQDWCFDAFVQLTDVAGNDTPVGLSACGESLQACLDGKAPYYKSITVDPDQETPLKTGTMVTVDLEMVDTKVKPAVFVGSGVMTSTTEEPDQGNGAVFWLWTFTRNLDGSEGEGPQQIAVAGLDEAGNSFSNAGEEPSLDLDFTPPEAQCQLSNNEAKAGDLVRLSATFSEPLNTGAASLESDTAFELNEEMTVYEGGWPKYVWDLTVPEGQVETTYQYAVSAVDPAGNLSAGPVCSGAGKLDGEPIVITDPKVEALYDPTGGDNLIADSYPWAKEGSTVRVSFKLAEVPETMTALLGTEEMALHTMDGDVHYYTEKITNPAGIGGLEVKPVTLILTDGAGNLTSETVAYLTVDYDAPKVVGTPYFERCDGYAPASAAWNDLWVSALPECEFEIDPEACGADVGKWTGQVRISFSLNEQTLADYRYVLVGETQALVDPCEQGSTVTAVYPLSGNETEGECAEVRALVQDLAGNPADILLGCLRFDFVEPDAPDVDTPDVIVYERIPWGAQASAGEPQFRVIGSEDAVDGEGLVKAYVISPAWEIGTTTAAENGSFEMVLSPGNRTSVQVDFTDPAGNVSDKAVVKAGEWIATLGGKIAGSTVENPHKLEGRGWLMPGFLQDAPGMVEFDGDAVELPGGESAWAEGAGKWFTRKYQFDGPVARAGSRAVWLPSRDAFFMAKGYAHSDCGDGNLTCGDEWLWSPEEMAWTESVSDGPAARSGHAMVYDAARGKVVLYGGESWGGCGEGTDIVCGWTWEWDERTGEWSVASVGGPPPRAGAQMAYDSRRGRVLLFGGQGLTEECDVLAEDHCARPWLWDGPSATWTKVFDKDPMGRKGHILIYDSARDEFVLYGGFIESWSCEEGDEADYCAYTWALDGETLEWELASETGPAQRERGVMVYDEDRQKGVLFGGLASLSTTDIADCSHNSTNACGHTWEWDGNDRSWTRVAETGPWPRFGQSMVYDPVRKKIWLWAGFGYGAPCGYICPDMWEYDGLNQAWQPLEGPVPSARDKHSLNYVPESETVVLYGGERWSGCQAPETDDCTGTWEWDGGTGLWSFTTPDGPGMRHSPATAYDPNGKRLLLAGGGGYGAGCSQNYCASAWQWSGESKIWESAVGFPAPPTRSEAQLSVDEKSGSYLFFGGNGPGGGGEPVDTALYVWSDVGQPWEAAAVDSAPPPRVKHALHFDPISETTLLFGGMEGWEGDCDSWGNGHCSNTLAWDGQQWQTLITGQGPWYGNNVLADWDESRRRIVRFGGCDLEDAMSSMEMDCPALFEWDRSNAQWRKVAASGPAPREYAAMAYDAVSERSMLWGGSTKSGCSESDSTFCDWFWLWDGGASSRPAEILYISFADQLPAGEHEITQVTVNVVAGGMGYDDEGGELPGVQMKVWDQGRWTDAAQTGAAPEAVGTLTWTSTDVQQMRRLFYGDEHYLIFAVTPLEPSGPGSAADPAKPYGEVVVDYAEGRVKYVLE